MDDIDTSELSESLAIKLKKIGLLSSRKIIVMDSSEFRKMENFTDEEIHLVKNAAANIIIPQGFKTVNEAKRIYKDKWRTLTFDCKGIDKLTGGGIPTRGINELYGVSGAGKTQFCLQLSITVQYPLEHGGLGKKAVYICTEDRFPARRLQEMVLNFPRGNFEIEGNCTDNILVDHIPQVEGLKDCILKRLPHVLKTLSIGLIVIDSITAVFRAEYGSDDLVARSKELKIIGSELHNLSRKFNVTILCVNQVADSLENNEVVPALGLVWSNLVTSRFQVLTGNDSKIFRVVAAPDMNCGECKYKITARGIEDG
ncbi:DNA repair protein XRCC3 [Cimex lectularius]|uniref:RecA family profile 1 domain-containing protein n=1 Tax=Cimex lectularius TaxID=79782 RepID=A0A8I6S6Z6_CIMLE|nr:DNA repair protein XRCC3 [Cimex lectularius]XP_014258937.1 DNA repair protein XRCC3 [Cimex lectularius]